VFYSVPAQNFTKKMLVFVGFMAVHVRVVAAAPAPTLPVFSETFAVNTVEMDDTTNTMTARQTIIKDSVNKRSHMIADGSLAHGHLEEFMRCDLHPMGYMLEMGGPAGETPAQWQCEHCACPRVVVCGRTCA
jgi:hypothetical protein